MAAVFKKKKRKGQQRAKSSITLEELAQQDDGLDVQSVLLCFNVFLQHPIILIRDTLREALEDQRMRRREQGIA
jgi:hypothetical protein